MEAGEALGLGETPEGDGTAVPWNGGERLEVGERLEQMERLDGGEMGSRKWRFWEKWWSRARVSRATAPESAKKCAEE